MIWLTWRQFRPQAWTVFAAVCAIVIVLVVTGPSLFNSYQADEQTFLNKLQFHRTDYNIYLVGLVALYALPPIIGAVWGAPLIARELEAGTHRLVWSQSVTRHRWLTSKLAVTGLAAVAVAGLLSLAVSWWASPIDRAIDDGTGAGMFSTARLEPLVFGARGVVPLGYAAFAFVLGVAIGLLLRRAVPAIAVTLAAVVALQFAMPLVVRDHLIAPDQLTTTITATNTRGMAVQGRPGDIESVQHLSVKAGNPGDWTISNYTIDGAGEVPRTLPVWVAECTPASGREQTDNDSQACFTRLAEEGFRQVVALQPASRFWALQWRETGVLLSLAVLLSGFCFWRIRRDLS